MDINPNNEPMKKIRFIREKTLKYAIHPAWGPIVKHEFGDEAEYPLSFCQRCVDAGAAEYIEDDNQKEPAKEEVEENPELKMIIDDLLKDCESDKERKAKLADWAFNHHGIKINKKYTVENIVKTLMRTIRV